MTTQNDAATGTAYEPSNEMQIVTAVFAENIDMKPAPGPSTQIDLTGIQFSVAATQPLPAKLTPHLIILVWNPPEGKPMGALEVQFFNQESRELQARNVQPLQIEPGKFNYRLVRAELDFDDYGTIVAACRIDAGNIVEVPFTLLAPVGSD